MIPKKVEVTFADKPHKRKKVIVKKGEEPGLIEDELGWYRRSCIAEVLRGKHCLVIGATGTGKTWWMAAVASHHFSRFIFVNPNLEQVVDRICAPQKYWEPSEVVQAILGGEIHIEFIPDENVKTAIEQLQELRLELFEVAESIDVRTGQWWLNFILDEAQTYAWKGSREDVDVFATRGRRYGIRSWFLTQRPQNISSTIINNVQNQIIFRTGPYEAPYFRNYRIPIEEEKEWLEKEYHYILFNGFEPKKCRPITGELQTYYIREKYDI